MDGIFQEFENENELRSYPFAAGCTPSDSNDGGIPTGLFVDAAIYPVNPSGIVYLSGVSEDGTISVSDGSGVIMTGVQTGRYVEMFDTSNFGRHVGTLVASSEDALSEFCGRSVKREFGRDVAAFAASCVFPVVIDGVTSISVGGTSPVTGDVKFANGDSDDVRVSSGSLEDGTATLRFDVLPRPGYEDPDSIKRIVCVVDGQTPFRIGKLSDNTILLTLDGIDKSVVCSSVHRENEFEMADTCECEKERQTEKRLPETYQLEEVFIPPDEDGTEGGTEGGAENAFFLVVPNTLGYENPLSITLDSGSISPMTGGPEIIVDGNEANLAEGALVDSVTSNGVIIQVPGLSGGEA